MRRVLRDVSEDPLLRSAGSNTEVQPPAIAIHAGLVFVALDKFDGQPVQSATHRVPPFLSVHILAAHKGR
jgi:hypothetical protein